MNCACDTAKLHRISEWNCKEHGFVRLAKGYLRDVPRFKKHLDKEVLTITVGKPVFANNRSFNKPDGWPT